ncbi:hypothetical protein [Thalassolituus oleivorans]|uniref:hypothetical protein n=1 Tax=Thalassolituus oleivorans TaxID=187493 RepID=UPI001B708DC4|nr:hypothetical protein [Thalassolituus oleivorans]MBQ0728673.1 hypothetical protein [Thalassolituus oleivorans]MBQ0779745.1 hypothetical protein [Thalassolituus oleivorans]
MTAEFRVNQPLYILFLLGLSFSSNSMESISDEELSNYSGQAFITIDASSYSDGAGDFSGNYEFTKVNFGVDVETLINVDELRIGEFERSYNDGDVGALEYVANPNFDDTDPNSSPYIPVTDADGNVPVPDADIIIQNFALGRVDNYNYKEVGDDEPVIVPFKMRDPYIELAYKMDTNGIRRIAGLRLGFGAAMGDLSGDLLALTGNLEGRIDGVASTALDELDCTVEWFLCGVSALDSGLKIYGPVQFVDPETGEGTRGGTYIKRATYMGVAEGVQLSSDDLALGFLPADWLVEYLSSSENCKTFGLGGCFKLTNYQSVYIGNKNANSFEEGAAEGAFISLQNEAVPWENLSGVGEDRILAERGAFLNITKFKDSSGNIHYPIYLDLYNALTGEPRVATCIGRTKGC